MCTPDLQEDNILLDLDDASALEAFEEEERTSPVARKVAADRAIYLSRRIVTAGEKYGRPVLCDFGEARFGRTAYTERIQPYQYRAPEVILRMPWNEKVDIWSVGLMVREGHASSYSVVRSHGFYAFVDLEHVRG